MRSWRQRRTLGLLEEQPSTDRHGGIGQTDLVCVFSGSGLDTFPFLGCEGRGLDNMKIVPG